MKTYSEFCRDFIIDELQNFEGETVYACDLGNELTNEINMNGTAFVYTEDSKEHLIEWFNEAGEFYEYAKNELCMELNPFEDVDKFVCCMVIEGVNSILNQLPTIDESWNDKIELTSEIIKTIIQELEEEAPEVNF